MEKKLLYHISEISELLMRTSGRLGDVNSVLQHTARQNLATVDDLFKVVQTYVASVLGESHTLLLSIYHPQTNTLNTHLKENGNYICINTPLAGESKYVIETQAPLCIQQLSKEKGQLSFKIANLTKSEEKESHIFVPLILHDMSLGMLSIQHPLPNAYGQEELLVLQLLASYVALALHNMRLHNSLSQLNATGQLLTQQVEERQVLNEISKEITSQLNLTRVFDLILEKALELTHSHMGNLMLYDQDRGDLWMAAECGVAEDKKGRRQNLDQGIVGYVAVHKQLLNVDPSQDPWDKVFLEYILGTHSELAVPMLAGDELRGVLNIESPNPGNFSESDERLLQGLGELAVVALQNAQVYEREKRLAEERKVLNEISKEIISQLDLSRVFDLILEKALALTHSDLCSLMLYDQDGDDLWMAAERGVAEDKKGKHQKLGQGVVGYVAAYKQLLNITDVSLLPWSEIFLDFFPGTRSELAVPMLAGDELRGVLNVESSVLNSFDKSDERLLQELADLAVIALQNAERYEKAEWEAQRFKLLYQAEQELSSITSLTQLKQAYDIVIRSAEMQSLSQVAIYFCNEKSTDAVLTYASHRKAPFKEWIKIEEGLNEQVARERRTLVIPDVNHSPSHTASANHTLPSMHSLLVTPILFKDQYYGNLALEHEDATHFRGTDINFFEALAQQLAGTIYRLETAKARQEFEQRALSAEEMSSIGQSAFEVTHRLGNDLGLIDAYIDDIQSELEYLSVRSGFVSKKLENIRQSVCSVLSFSSHLKQELAKLGATEDAVEEPILISAREVLEEASLIPSLPPNIQIDLEVDYDVAQVLVIRSLTVDILRNLVDNAIHAMHNGGKISLRGRNAGHSVALEVTDTGVGIPAQKLPKIFDLFFSTKGSSGFGLWSARRNALKNHGDLKVVSELGQGTTFTLLLPRTDVRISRTLE